MINFELDTADVLQVLLLILGIMLVFQAFWLFGTALFPRMVGQARDRYKTPIRTTLIGLAVVVTTFFIGFWLVNRDSDISKVIGLVIGVVPLMLGVIGSAGLCQLIGLGLPAPGDQSQNWRRVWRGGWVLNFCYLLPGPGWVFLAWSIISGCGAFVTSLSGRGNDRENDHSNDRGRGRGSSRAPRKSPAIEPAAKLDDDSPRSSRLQRSQIPSGDSENTPTQRPRRPRRPSRPKPEE